MRNNEDSIDMSCTPSECDSADSPDGNAGVAEAPPGAAGSGAAPAGTSSARPQSEAGAEAEAEAEASAATSAATVSIDSLGVSRRDYRLPIAALILLAIIWGYSWVVMKIALDYTQPFTFAALRTFLGAIPLLIALPLLRRPLKPKALGPTAILGLLQTTGFVGLMTWALADGGAGKTSILTYTMPFWLLLMAWVVLGEKLKGFQWVAVGLALCGLVLILTPWRLEGKTSDLLAIGGAISWAASAVYAKVLRKRHEVDLLSLTAWQLLLGSIPLIIIAACTWSGPSVWSSGTFIWTMIYSTLLASGIAWILWLYILDSLSAGTAGLSSLLNPVIGITCAWIQLGERPGLLEGLGMAAIVAALLVVVLREALRGRKPPSLSRR